MTYINRVSTDDFGNVEGIEELLYTSDSIEYEDITALERVGLDTVEGEVIQDEYQPFNASTMIRYDAALNHDFDDEIEYWETVACQDEEMIEVDIMNGAYEDWESWFENYNSKYMTELEKLAVCL